MQHLLAANWHHAFHAIYNYSLTLYGIKMCRREVDEASSLLNGKASHMVALSNTILESKSCDARLPMLDCDACTLPIQPFSLACSMIEALAWERGGGGGGGGSGGLVGASLSSRREASKKMKQGLHWSPGGDSAYLAVWQRQSERPRPR